MKPPSKRPISARLVWTRLRDIGLQLGGADAVRWSAGRPTLSAEALVHHLASVIVTLFVLYSWIGLLAAYLPAGSHRLGVTLYSLLGAVAPILVLIFATWPKRRQPIELGFDPAKARPQLALAGLLSVIAGLVGLALAGVFWNALGTIALAQAKREAAASNFWVDFPAATGPASADEKANAAFWILAAEKEHQASVSKKSAPVAARPSEEVFAREFLARAQQAKTLPSDWVNARKLVDSHRRELELLHRAASCRTVDWGIDWSVRPTWDVRIPQYGSIASLARLLAIRALIEARDGRVDVAERTLRDGIVVAEAVGRPPFVISRMVSASLYSILLDAAAPMLLRAPLADGRQFAPLLDAEFLARRFREAVQFEHFGHVATFGEIGFTETYRGRLSSGRDLNEPGLWWYWPFFKLDIASFYRAALGFNRALALPYVKAQQPWKTAQDDFDRSVLLVGAFAGETNWLRLYRRHQEAATKVALASAAIAARSFKAGHGRWPADIVELERENGGRRFDDPFTGEPLRLGREGAHFLLYSVGPDGADDHGARYDAETGKGDIAWNL